MSNDKRQKILDTARKLFIKYGIESTPTSRIAKEAKVATGTLFHHFPTKEALVNELYGSIIEQASRHQREQFIPTGETREDIRRLWSIDIRWKCSHPEYAHFMERYSLFYYASEDTIQLMRERYAHVIEIFQTAIDKGMMKIPCLEYVKKHYIWSMRMNVTIFLERPDLLTDENLDKTFEIYWGGIATLEHQ